MSVKSIDGMSYLKGRRFAEYGGLTIVDLLRRKALEVPHRTALVCGGFSVSYGGFDGLTDFMALELARRGVRRHDRVGILSRNSEVAFTSIFGIIKTGASYVPLSPQYPPARLLRIIEEAQIGVVIAGDGVEGAIAGFGGEVIDGRELLRSSVAGGSVPGRLPGLPAPPLPDDIIMIEYTSGSTGNPKGVMISHKNALSYPAFYKRITGLTEGDAAACYSGLSFIVHMFDFFAAVMAGAAIHIIVDGMRLDTRVINDYFEANNITAAFVPVSFGRRFILQEDNKSLRVFSMGGEQFIPLPELSRPYKIYNIYGCTECGPASTVEVTPGAAHVTAGTPVDNIDIYIVDEKGDIVERGEVGELCAAGHSVTAGYLSLPEKTGEVFIGNRFSAEPGFERLYRTGDLARINENGEIEIIGRLDFQIKIRGLRIEPGDIDSCIRKFPDITESVTVAVENRAGIKQLVSYVVAGVKIDAERLKRFAAEALPSYMVPQFVEQLSELPRNINGKIDRPALPPPRYGVAESLREPPDGGAEIRLAGIWASVLGLDEGSIDRGSDFFRLGGDSLRATVLSLEISKAFDVKLTPMELINTPVLKDQAVALMLAEGFRAVHAYSASGGKTPVFFVHGGNTGSQALAEIAGGLSSGRPAYCIENYNLHHPGSRIKGIRAIASEYIKFTREVTPSGPVILCGWSYGGLIAFEMACQLEQAGKRPEHLYLLDCGLITGPLEKNLNEKLLAQNSYQEYLAKDPLFERFRHKGLLTLLIDNYREIFDDMFNYSPAVTYHGEATLFKAARPDPVSPGALPQTVEIIERLWQIAVEKKDGGFGACAPRLRIIEIPDTHDGLVRGETSLKIASVIEGATEREVMYG